MSARRALTRLRAPGERDAEDRSWEVVRFAYLERTPVPNRPSYRRPASALAAGVVLLGALALSPAGATVGRLITRALGVENAAPALSSLPAPGRLLVSRSEGSWIVNGDGSISRLGQWPQASWSPHGLYVTVIRGNRLAAVDPRGAIQWALVRRGVRDPRWYPPVGYRVAYLSGMDLRVVAGDGSGDHLLAARVADVAPTWRPSHPYQLAYITSAGRVVVRDADTGRIAWTVRVSSPIVQLAWSPDGQRLLALSRTSVRVYGANGARKASFAMPGGLPAIDGALSPDGQTLALVLGLSGSDVVIEDLSVRHPAPRRVLPGPGLRQVVWSPNGKWLLVSWPVANQWVFVRVAAAPRIQAVSRIAQQFGSASGHGFPELDGWCCTAYGTAG
jgi:hypothetical protein